MCVEERIFLEFFKEEKKYSDECIKNYKDKKLVFVKKIGSEKYYIKKYIPYGKREKTIAFGLWRDRALHYKDISEKLKILGISHVEPYYIKVQRYSFFKRASILVTKDSGESLENYIVEFPKYKEQFKKFFDIYIYLAKNKIYCTDYNPDGVLINENRELLLIDFDAFKTKIFLTKKYKKYLIEELRKIYSNIQRKKDFEEFCKKEIERVIKELGWKE